MYTILFNQICKLSAFCEPVFSLTGVCVAEHDSYSVFGWQGGIAGVMSHTYSEL